MSYELFIGLRYLKAKRKQTFISVITLISILGVTVGVTALIIVLSVMTGFEEDLREKILGVNAHLVVLELGRGMKNYNEAAQKVKGVKGVLGATPFTYNQAMISSKDGVMGVVVRGLDINTVGEVTTLPNKMKQGSLDGLRLSIRETYDTLDTSAPGIVIGKELAKNLSISIGEEINLVSPLGTMTAMGAIPRMARFKVAGIFEFGMYEYDSSIAFISIENSQKFFRQYDAATGIEVKIDNIYKAKEIGDRIQNALGAPFWTRTWMEMNKNLFSALKLEKIAMFIILILIIMVAAFNIISTLIMVVMEKSKDIAILKSMGATSAGIMKIFMIEGLVIGIAGTVIGTSGGVLSCLLLKKYQFIKLPSDVYYISTLPVRMDGYLIGIISVAAICITFLATLYPSWQASKLDPVDVIRYE